MEEGVNAHYVHDVNETISHGISRLSGQYKVKDIHRSRTTEQWLTVTGVPLQSTNDNARQYANERLQNVLKLFDCIKHDRQTIWNKVKNLFSMI